MMPSCNFKYSFVLNKLLLNNSNPTKQKLITNIKIVNNILFYSGITTIFITILSILKFFINPFVKLFVEWFIIYLSEIITLCGIIYSLSYKYRNIQQSPIKQLSNASSGIKPVSNFSNS